jgi:acyl-CoA oxidase
VTKLHAEEKATMGQITMTKAWATLKGREVVSLARELMGGNGIILENEVIKYFMDMEAIYTYEGTYEVNALVTGRELTGIAAFK